MLGFLFFAIFTHLFMTYKHLPHKEDMAMEDNRIQINWQDVNVTTTTANVSACPITMEYTATDGTKYAVSMSKANARWLISTLKKACKFTKCGD